MGRKLPSREARKNDHFQYDLEVKGGFLNYVAGQLLLYVGTNQWQVE